MAGNLQDDEDNIPQAVRLGGSAAVKVIEQCKASTRGLKNKLGAVCGINCSQGTVIGELMDSVIVGFTVTKLHLELQGALVLF